MKTQDLALGETLRGKLGVYHKVPTPESTSVNECHRSCALYSGRDSYLCPRRGPTSAYAGTTLDCVIDLGNPRMRMRFVWKLITDYTQVDEGGVV